MLTVVELSAGLMVVAFTFFDIFQTIVLPRPTPVAFRPSGRILVGIYGVCRRAALRSSKRRELILGTFAPLMVVLLLLFWGAGLVIGYGLILHALSAQVHPSLKFATGLYLSATSLLTLGFGDFVPTGGIARLVVIAEGATGLGLFALVITFLYSLFGEFQRREVLVITLSSRAGAPPSGVALLRTYAEEGMVTQLGGVFADWEVWAAQVLDSHLSYPLLPYFRSTHDNHSWLSTLGAVLDAATLLQTTIEDVPRGPAKLMLRGGLHLVGDLAQYFHLHDRGNPYVERSEFDIACEQLRSAGYRLVETGEAWQAFANVRSDYAGALNAMADLWATPPAQWIGGRPARIRHRNSPLSR